MSNIGNPMSFVPRFPWNDDERDTSSFIQYYSQCQDCNHNEDNNEYIPTYIIMKEFYQEQERELYCDTPAIDDYYMSYDAIDLIDDEVCSLSSNDTFDSDVKSDENATKVEEDDESTSSPYVSNKYWYM